MPNMVLVSVFDHAVSEFAPCMRLKTRNARDNLQLSLTRITRKRQRNQTLLHKRRNSSSCKFSRRSGSHIGQTLSLISSHKKTPLQLTRQRGNTSFRHFLTNSQTFRRTIFNVQLRTIITRKLHLLQLISITTL